MERLDSDMLDDEEEEPSYRVVVELVFCQRDTESINYSRENQLAQNTAVVVLPETLEFPEKPLAVDSEDVAEVLS